MDETAFFEQLRQETETVFQSSPVKKKQDSLGRQWSYSLCATPIRRRHGVIFGLNWGGGSEQDIDPKTRKPFAYPPQAEMPDGTDIEDYRFIRQSLPLLKTYLGVTSPAEINYTNLCFFRTPTIADLEEEDWDLSLPLFRKFVKFIDPPWLLMLGTSGLWKLQELELLTDLKDHDVVQGKKTCWSYSAETSGKPFAAVPHPQAHLKSEVRSQLWELACNNLKINPS